MSAAVLKQKIMDLILLTRELSNKESSSLTALGSECELFYASQSQIHSGVVVDQQVIINAMLQCGVTISDERVNDIIKTTKSYLSKDGTIAEGDVFGVVCKILESDESFHHEVQCDLVDQDENEVFFISDIRCYRKLNGVKEGNGLGLHNTNKHPEKTGTIQSQKTIYTNKSDRKIQAQVDELIRLIQNMQTQEHSDVVDVMVQGADGYFGNEEFVAALEKFGLNVPDKEIRALKELIHSPKVEEDAFSICCTYLKEMVASSPQLRDISQLTLVKVDELGMVYCISIQYIVASSSQKLSLNDTDSLRANHSISASSVSSNTLFDEFNDLTIAIKTLIREANIDDIQFHTDITKMISEMKALLYKASFVSGDVLIQEDSKQRKSIFKYRSDYQTSDKVRHRVSFLEDPTQWPEGDLDDVDHTTPSHDNKNPRNESFHRTDSEKEWEEVMKGIHMKITKERKNVDENSLQNDNNDEEDAAFSLRNSFQRNKLLVALKTFRGMNGEELTKEEVGDACIQYYFDEQSSFYKKIFDPFSFANRLQCQKLEKFFYLLDVKNDGTITKEDFIEWGRRVAHLSGTNFTSELQKAFLNVHDSYFGNGTGESLEQWVEFMGMMSNLPDAVELGANTAVTIFQAMDSNHDNDVSFDEFRVFVEAVGVSSEDAKMSFDMIDQDGNGKLSKKEISEAFAHYLFDKEPSIFQNFFGPFFALEPTVADSVEDQQVGTKGTIKLRDDTKMEGKSQRKEIIKAFEEDLSDQIKLQIDISASIADKFKDNDKEVGMNNMSATIADKFKVNDKEVGIDNDEKISEEKLGILEVKEMIDKLKSKEEESSRTAKAAYLKEEKRLDAIKAAFDELFSDWEVIRSQNLNAGIK